MTTNSPNPVDGDVKTLKQNRIDHSKLAAEIVHNLVSTDSCDEEVTEKLILWVLNRLNKEFPTPPAQLLRQVALPQRYRATLGKDCNDAEPRAVMLPARDGAWLSALDVEHCIRAAGYEVKS